MSDDSRKPDEQRYDQETVMRNQSQQVMTPTGPVVQQVAVTESYDRMAAQHARFRWVSGLVYFLFGLLEILIALRFVLKLVPANPDNGFVRFVYNVTAPFMAPFLTVLPAISRREGAVLELSALVAIIVYSILAWVIVRVARLLIERPSSGTSASRVERRDG